MKTRTILLGLTAMLCISIVAGSANAQATRTWVSGVGDDVNPCSRTAPCKTFAGAISKTAAGGEINCLDPGGFGSVNITKSMTIDCKQIGGSILASAATGVIVNGSGINVRLRGLNINGAGAIPGLNGVRIVSAARVNIEEVVIDGFSQNGISIESSTDVKVFVDNSTIRNVTGIGVTGNPTVSASISITGSRFSGNGTAISAGANATIRIAGNIVTHNTTGLAISARGTIISFQNNVIAANTTNGTPTSTAPLM